MKKTLFLTLFTVVSTVFINSCSNEEFATGDEAVLTTANMHHLSTVEDQLMHLTKRVTPYHNFRVAEARGYDENLVYMPNMGDHFVKHEIWDDTFNYLEPEILIYIINDKGEREFVGVEYLVWSDEETAPEGFIGDDDVWAHLGGGLWALHAWIILENPDGIFHATNSNVTY